MTELSNTLADLAEQVREANDAFLVTQKKGAEQAIATGILLCHAKDACAHGEWLPFLKRACVPERSAQRFMKLARSGLKPDSVSDLGGISAALEYIGKRSLPGPDEILFIYHEEDLDNKVSAIVQPSPDHPGYFDLAIVDVRDPSPAVVRTVTPFNPKSIFVDGQFWSALWWALDDGLDIPMSKRTFCILPAYVIENDFDFLEGLPNVDDLNQVSVSNAPLPRSYEAALKAVNRCVSNFSPVTYRAACLAMAIAAHKTEQWPGRETRALATYARIANDQILSGLAKHADAMADLAGLSS